MTIPEEVNNTNILYSREEALDQSFGQSDDMNIENCAQKYRQLFGREQRRSGQSDVVPQDYVQVYPHKDEQRPVEWFKQSDVLPQDDMNTKINARVYRHLFEQELQPVEWFKQSDVLPQDLRNIPAEALGFMGFLTFILHSVFLIPGNYHRALYILMFCVVRYQAQALITQSASKLGTQSPLSMGGAFTEFFPQITQMMTIMLCYLLMLWLVCPLNPVMQISIMLLLIAAPWHYIPQVLRMASGVDVICGFFKVPLIWFTASVAIALALIFVFMSLLLIYLIRRFIHPGNLRENPSNFIHPGNLRENQSNFIYPGNLGENQSNFIHPGNLRENQSNFIHPGNLRENQSNFIHPGNLRENPSNFIHPGDPRVEKLIEVSLDALSGENMA